MTVTGSLPRALKVVTRRNLVSMSLIQKRYRIYTQDRKGTRSRYDEIKELHKQTPQAYQDLCKARKENPWRTFWAPGGNPNANIAQSYALYFAPVGFMIGGYVILDLLIQRRERNKNKNKNDE